MFLGLVLAFLSVTLSLLLLIFLPNFLIVLTFFFVSDLSGIWRLFKPLFSRWQLSVTFDNFLQLYYQCHSSSQHLFQDGFCEFSGVLSCTRTEISSDINCDSCDWTFLTYMIFRVVVIGGGSGLVGCGWRCRGYRWQNSWFGS